MIFLVLMLTPAYASQLDITKYSGVDEINGYARSNDQITIQATAEIYGNPTPDIAARRLKVYHSGISERFQTCSTFGQNTYKCTYTTTGVYSGTQNFKIDLLDADGTVVESTDKTITIDYLSPSIKKFEIIPKKTKENTITIDYKTEDYATGTGDTSTCSGIKETAFFVNNEKIASESGQTSQCTKENTIQYTAPATDSYEKITMCAKATDMLEQQSNTVCQDYEIDQHAPEITEVNVKDADGFIITGITSQKEITGTIEAVIQGDNDDVDVVTADFSSLNPSITELRAPDEIINNHYIWKNILITNPSECQIKIRAIDTLGNQAEETKTCTLPLDDSGPEAVKIETNHTDTDGTLLISSKGTITTEIREAGAGMYKKHAYMDLSSLGTYSTQQRANECHIKTGDVWECSWEISPNVPDGDYKIKLSPATRDDLDNGIASTIQETIRVDKNPPIIEDVDFTVDHAFAQYGDKTVKGDVIEFSIKTKDTQYSYANFTSLGGGYTPGICTGENTITCTFTQTITKSGPEKALITFDFFDRAGNKQTYSREITIYALSQDLSPEYWKSTVECSPKLIDRKTTTLKEQLVYCHVHLDSTNHEAEPIYTAIDETLSECTGTKQGIAEIQMINNGYQSRDPYIKITLSLSEFNINNMSLSCPIHISTQIGDYFSKTDEKEIIDINLEFYDLPMGEIYENLEKDIKWEMEKAMELNDWISDLVKIEEMARTICEWKTTATSLLTALDSVLGAFILPLQVLTADKDYQKSVDNLRKSICNNVKGPAEEWLFEREETKKETGMEKILGKDAGIIQSTWEWLDMFCDFLNCRLTWDDERYKEAEKSGGLAQGTATFLVGGGGGGTPAICKNVQEFFSGKIGLGETTYANYQKIQKDFKKPGEKTPQLTDVKESLFWSTICHCIPGIHYNINKLREINCKYALCLAQDVSTQGLNPAWCRAEKSYLQCTYVMGEIFSIFPLLSFYDKAVNTVKEWFENPLSIIDAVSGCLCGGCAEFGINPFCGDNAELTPAQQAEGYFICILPKTFSKVMDAVLSIQSMPSANKKDFEIGNSYCQQAMENDMIRQVYR